MEKPKSVTIGRGKCPIPTCSHVGAYGANKSGNVYFHCVLPANGGCKSQFHMYADEGNTWLAGHVQKWTKPEYRKIYLEHGEGMDPSPADDPAPEDPPPADDQVAEGEDAETLPPPVPVPPPAPPRRRAAAPAPVRQAPPPPRKKGGTFLWED